MLEEPGDVFEPQEEPGDVFESVESISAIDWSRCNYGSSSQF